MQTNLVHNHDDDNTIAAMGADDQKVEFILNHIQQARERGHHTRISESLSVIIKMANTPEEIALCCLAIGKATSDDRSPKIKLLKVPNEIGRLLEMLSQLDDLIQDDDGPDTEE